MWDMMVLNGTESVLKSHQRHIRSLKIISPSTLLFRSPKFMSQSTIGILVDKDDLINYQLLII